ncbi:MAG: hypothetical protein HY877_05140 [Deltaproteobacteria bacterium]|nr:hypothetical protein [Deltaproteobacteria bacterium]
MKNNFEKNHSPSPFSRHFSRPLLISFLAMSLVACSKGVGGSPELVGNPSSTSPGGVGVSSTNAGSQNNFDFGNQISVQKMIYHVGPVDLPAGQSVDVMLDKPAILRFQVTEPVWVIGFEPKVINGDGKALTGQLLYKALVVNKHESNPVCASGNSGNPFAVATSTLTKVELPEGFGYPILPKDPLEAKVVFHNPTDKDYSGVVFSFEIQAIPMEKGKGISDVKAMLLDTDPCNHKPIAIEPGAFVEKSHTFTIPNNGNLMVANGLLSDYGVAVSLTHQEGDKASLVPFWRAEATLDETHRIIDLTPNPFIDPAGKKIAQGDKLTLGVSFDNFSEKWHNEATGSAMVYLAPSDK